MKLLQKLILIFFLCILAFPIFAEDKNASNLLTGINKIPSKSGDGNIALKFLIGKYYEPLGITFTLDNNNLEILIYQTKALAAVPFYKKFGLLNSNFSQTQVDIHRIGIAGIIGFFQAATIISHIYYYTDINKLHVRAYLISDSNKSTQTSLLFTFNFTRDFYNKMKWDHSSMLEIGLSRDKITKVQSEFRFSNWYLQAFDLESARDK